VSGGKAIEYPHGIAIHNGIDSILVTTTVHPSDLGDPGEHGKRAGHARGVEQEVARGEAPVKILFAPGSNSPAALITDMFGNILWDTTWNPLKSGFDVQQIMGTAEFGGDVLLE